MKKRSRKLALNRETLRSLQTENLKTAAGAGTSEECIAPTGCDCGGSQGGTDCYSPTMCMWGCSISGATCRHC
ncbi:MAG TPA: class I lanthipeptide [Thermoanaerobaculia bacterium]